LKKEENSGVRGWGREFQVAIFRVVPRPVSKVLQSCLCILTSCPSAIFYHPSSSLLLASSAVGASTDSGAANAGAAAVVLSNYASL
jgi:hypothetical protein